jgi:multidrug efflux pump subunit AcrB
LHEFVRRSLSGFFLFLRNVRATIIPTLAPPTSIVGTYVMNLLGLSLDNLSLMALTLSVWFVSMTLW